MLVQPPHVRPEPACTRHALRVRATRMVELATALLPLAHAASLHGELATALRMRPTLLARRHDHVELATALRMRPTRLAHSLSTP